MKILFITLSNIGDCLLTLPVLDCLKGKFPQAEITCLVPVRPQEIFQDNPAVTSVIVYDKKSSIKEKIRLFFRLSKENFDLVVDLRNSFLGAVLPAKKRSFSLKFFPPGLQHMRLKHLFRAGYSLSDALHKTKTFQARKVDEEHIDKLLASCQLNSNNRLIALCPGARSHIKRWNKDKFVELCKKLLGDGYQIILVGDKMDAPICHYIQDASGEGVFNFCGQTNIRQLAALLEKVKLLISNDSAAAHLASYLDKPVLVIFGPTDDSQYGPWSSRCAVAKKEIFCRPCEKAQCHFNSLACMELVKTEDVLKQAKALLAPDACLVCAAVKAPFKRILVCRTDRLGDVLLSTPVISALRRQYPNAYIAMLVSGGVKEALEANQDLDRLFILDKGAKDRSLAESFSLIGEIKKEKFDLAIILHPTIRVHLIVFLAGVTKRLGYSRKAPFLLTDRIAHLKQEGSKHESEYALDMVRYLGILPVDKKLTFEVAPKFEKYIEQLFHQEGLAAEDKLLAIHPAASCASKIWPAERFALVADKLADRYGFKVLIFASAKDKKIAQAVQENMRHQPINLAGKTSVGELAAAIKRCQLFISNDSGPVHLACALGVPVIVIFGRKQPGLSPRRWGPLGIKDKILHGQANCDICLAHNCKNDFACLKSIGVEDVLKAAEQIYA
ncbi:MAG: lipopolysaccharide heptosyltransferase II [Candidatus Omnitrophica bacterium]|jgi:heptosyltransferase-2|nr:lipopolysaccharide heptosyltransferase II [Candidatus Omnitrophota bacterium]